MLISTHPVSRGHLVLSVAISLQCITGFFVVVLGLVLAEQPPTLIRLAFGLLGAFSLYGAKMP